MEDDHNHNCKAKMLQATNDFDKLMKDASVAQN